MRNLTAGIAIAIVAFSSQTLLLSASCSQPEIFAGLCSVGSSTTDTSVVLDGTSGGGATTDADLGEGDGSWSDELLEAGGIEPECEFSTIEPDRCFRDPPDPPDPAASAPVTITDVAAFTPAFAAAASEPAGWAIAGLPANLVGPSEAVVVIGTLLGSTAEVRFTPVAWHWDHGDGTAVTHSTGGATWAASGVPEFSATSTSHVFTAPGTVDVGLSLLVVAEYRVGGGAWTPVVGTLTIPVSGFELVIATADTVLVDRDCLARPSGAGC